MRYLGPAFFDEAPIILCICLRGQQPGFGVRFVVKEDNAGIGYSDVLVRLRTRQASESIVNAT
jgi:hypothetical protein